MREEEEYRSDGIADTEARSSDSEYINYASERSDDDVLWKETVSIGMVGGCIGCSICGMVAFPFLIVSLAGAVNL